MALALVGALVGAGAATPPTPLAPPPTCVLELQVLSTPRSIGCGGGAGVAEGAGLKIQGRRVSPELPGHSEDSCLDCLVSFGTQDSECRMLSVGSRAQGGQRTAEGGGKGWRGW